MLKCIGSGSAFNTELGSNSMYWIQGKTLFLFDCGELVYHHLKTNKILEGVQRIVVFVTHRHPDHVGSLGTLIYHAHYVLKCPIELVTPDDEDLRKMLRLMGVEDELYSLLGLGVGPCCIYNTDFVYAVEWIEVPHRDHMLSFAYVIACQAVGGLGRRVFYYSGDASGIPATVLDRLKDGTIDVFYQDTCGADYEGNVHLSYRKLKDLIPEELRHKIWCMHLDHSFDVKQAEIEGFNVVRPVWL